MFEQKFDDLKEAHEEFVEDNSYENYELLKKALEEYSYLLPKQPFIDHDDEDGDHEPRTFE